MKIIIIPIISIFFIIMKDGFLLKLTEKKERKNNEENEN